MDPKIQLVRCPIDDPSQKVDQWYLPLDLMALATAVDPRCEIEVIDGTLSGLEDVARAIDPNADCVGFSYSALSVSSLAALTSLAASNGSIVIVGGQAAVGARASLVEEKLIDAVCVGDGEPTMSVLSRQLLNAEIDLAHVPNLLLSDGLGYSRRQEVDLSRQEPVKRTVGGVDAESYIGRFFGTNTLTNITGSRPSNVFSKRGCPRRCSFCARQDKVTRCRDPHVVAEEIQATKRDYRVDYVIDTSDTWISQAWSKRFAVERVRAGIQDIPMMVFADVRDISASTVQLMRDSGIESVLLGVESGSERMLRNNGKAMKRRTIIDAVNSLVGAGILVSASFVVGLLGEDSESLADTLSLAELLSQRPGVLCYANVIMPLMGSPLWSAVFDQDRSWPSCVTRAFDYDLAAVRDLYVSVATDVPSVHVLEQVCEDIMALSSMPLLEYAR